MSKKGIDVSRYQGNIDWNRVKADGIEFAIIRAGYGKTNVDPQAHANLRGATAAGIPVGVYWFSYALNAADAETEARKCLEVIAPYQIRLPIFYDFEYDTVAYAAKQGVTLGKAQFNAFTLAFSRVIRAAGHQAGVYFNRDYLRTMVDADLLEGIPTWYARYATTLDYTCDLWQYSSTGSVTGIAGDVDMNILFNENLIAPREEEEEPMTQEQFDQMFKIAMDRYLAQRNTLPPSDWVEDWDAIIATGITDGTMPQGFATREQAATMVYRALKRE